MSGIATLPIENPVLIFFIVLVIILFARYYSTAYVFPTSSV